MYEDILAGAPDRQEISPAWIDETRALLKECVLSSTISDTSFTTFCSGGLDSSLITRIAEPEIAYHCNYSDPECNETFFAQQVVAGHKERLFVINAQEEFDLVTRLGDIVKDFDELTIGSVILPLDDLLAQVKRRYKVILTGTGGDELFAGYVRYQLVLGDCFQDSYRALFARMQNLESPAERFEMTHSKGDVGLYHFYQPSAHQSFHDAFEQCMVDSTPLEAMLRFDRRYFLSGLLNIDDKMCGRHSLRAVRASCTSAWCATSSGSAVRAAVQRRAEARAAPDRRGDPAPLRAASYGQDGIHDADRNVRQQLGGADPRGDHGIAVQAPVRSQEAQPHRRDEVLARGVRIAHAGSVAERVCHRMTGEAPWTPFPASPPARPARRSRMRILFVTITFHPEPGALRGLPLAKRLIESGDFEVTVLTAVPWYPLGHTYPGYRQRAWQWETIDRCARAARPDLSEPRLVRNQTHRDVLQLRADGARLRVAARGPAGCDLPRRQSADDGSRHPPAGTPSRRAGRAARRRPLAGVGHRVGDAPARADRAHRGARASRGLRLRVPAR